MKTKLLLAIRGLICLSCSTLQITSAMSTETGGNALQSTDNIDLERRDLFNKWKSDAYQAHKRDQLLIAKKKAADLKEIAAQMRKTITAATEATPDIALFLKEAISNLEIKECEAAAANTLVEWLETAERERAETIDPKGVPDMVATDLAQDANYRAIVKIKSLREASLHTAQIKVARKKEALAHLSSKLSRYHDPITKKYQQ